MTASACPVCAGQAAPPRIARRQSRNPVDRRLHRPSPAASSRCGAKSRLLQARSPYRRAPPPRDRRASRIPRLRGPQLSRSQSQRCHPLRRRRPAHPSRHPDRLAVCAVSSTFSTNPPSASISATTSASSQRSSPSVTSATPSSSSSTMKRPSATPITSSTSAPEPVNSAAMSLPKAHRLTSCSSEAASLTGRVSLRRNQHPASHRAPPAQRQSTSSSRARAATVSRTSRRRFPLGVMTVITGVSGSGKEHPSQRHSLSFAREANFTARAKSLENTTRIKGFDQIDKAIRIDQSPIGRTPRSNPATYTGVFTAIRDLYAMLPEARERGYKPGRFSFNVAGGRCETCQGDGQRRIEMNFMPDVYVTCEVCNGKPLQSGDPGGEVQRLLHRRRPRSRH
jgi:hypothetical protein